MSLILLYTLLSYIAVSLYAIKWLQLSRLAIHIIDFHLKLPLQAIYRRFIKIAAELSVNLRFLRLLNNFARPVWEWQSILQISCIRHWLASKFCFCLSVARLTCSTCSQVSLQFACSAINVDAYRWLGRRDRSTTTRTTCDLEQSTRVTSCFTAWSPYIYLHTFFLRLLTACTMLAS